MQNTIYVLHMIVGWNVTCFCFSVAWLIHYQCINLLQQVLWYRVCRCAHVFQEAASDAEGLLQTQLQLLKEVMLVKVSQLLQVPKDDSSLSPQVLGHVGTLQLRDVVLHHVPQRSHILSLRLKQLLHDALEFTVSRRHKHNAVWHDPWSLLQYWHY